MNVVKSFFSQILNYLGLFVNSANLMASFLHSFRSLLSFFTFLFCS